MNLFERFYIVGKINGVESEMKYSLNPLKKWVGKELIKKYIKELEVGEVKR